MDLTSRRRPWKRGRWLAFGLPWLLLVYPLSIGPMTVLLRFHGGDAGSRIWHAAYGEPLGKLPRPMREAVNAYLGFSERTYWRVRQRVR